MSGKTGRKTSILLFCSAMLLFLASWVLSVHGWASDFAPIKFLKESISEPVNWFVRPKGLAGWLFIAGLTLLVIMLVCFLVAPLLESTRIQKGEHLWSATTFRRNTRSWTTFYLILAAVSVAGAFFSWLFFNQSGCKQSCGGVETLSLSITALEIFLIVVAVFGFWSLRRLTEATAAETAETSAKRRAEVYLKENASKLVKESLNDGEVIARLQQRLQTFGIDGVDDDQKDIISIFEMDSGIPDEIEEDLGGDQ